jgi:putative molybdopterin biosynthesis protein
MAQELLTLTEVAQILRISYPRAAELVRQGLLPAVRLGRQVRISPERLSAWIASGGEALPGGWRKAAQ